MPDQKIRIDEENIRLLWGLLIVLSLSAGIYLTGTIIWAEPWGTGNIRLILCLLLFAIGFYSIIQITRPLFHFNLFIEQQLLRIEIWKDEDTLLDTRQMPLNDIASLRISPYRPRETNEALFDFSTNFYLLYRRHHQSTYQPLIHLQNQSFTLKVEDIRKVIRFLCVHNPRIIIPENQSDYFAG